jgi:8-oxo-dGTP pyrophosphatase MutT (NUDIX family)
VWGRGPLGGTASSPPGTGAPIILALSGGASAPGTLDLLGWGTVTGVIAVDVLTAPPLPTLPTVCGVDEDLLVEGETVTVDGSRGAVDLEAVEGVEVVTSLLQRDDGKLLLLQRSSRVGSFGGRWAGVSGFLESRPPEEQARREIVEETGLAAADIELRATAEPIYVRDGRHGYIVHPFLFGARRSDVRLDWEHSELRWVAPQEIGSYPTVPKLAQVWRALSSPAVERKR